MVKLLVDNGADVNCADRDGWTPLHAAGTCGHTQLVKFLISRGANLIAVNNDGDMPFDITDDDITFQYFFIVPWFHLLLMNLQASAKPDNKKDALYFFFFFTS